MKKLALALTVFAAAASVSAFNYDEEPTYQTKIDFSRDLTLEIPEIDISGAYGFERVPNVAQYKGADWSQAVGIARGISLNEAYEIAAKMPEVTYFFHMKGFNMILETQDGAYRHFSHGDTVFFTGTPCWGSAPGLADGYIRKAN